MYEKWFANRVTCVTMQALRLEGKPVDGSKRSKMPAMYYIKCRDIQERTALTSYLKDKGVNAVFHYIPLHSAAAGLKYGRFHGEDRYTTKESERLLRLPLYYGLTEEDAATVMDALHAFYR